MTLLCIAIGWLGIACVTASLWHMLRRGQPRDDRP